MIIPPSLRIAAVLLLVAASKGEMLGQIHSIGGNDADVSQPRPTLQISDSLNPLPERFVRVPDSYKEFRGIVMAESNAITYVSLLPFVFFDSASAEISDWYVLFDNYEQTLPFDENHIPGDAVGKHRQILNVIASRLRQNPGARIGITANACDEGEPTTIAAERAKSVQRYFRKIWRIPEEQVVLGPESSSWIESRRTPQGKAANRRAEFSILDSVYAWRRQADPSESITWKLFRPLVDSTPRVFPFPPSITLQVQSGVDDSLVVSRAVEVRRNGELWNRLTGECAMQTEVPYTWTSNRGEVLQRGDTILTFQLVVQNADGTEHRSPEVRVLVLYISDRQAREEFRTIRSVVAGDLLHDLSTGRMGDMGEWNHEVARRFFLPAVDTMSIIDILGFYNNAGLADRRLRIASMAADEIGAIFQKKTAEKYRSLRIAVPVDCSSPFDDETTEGYCLNRMVRIVADSFKGVDE